MNKKDLRILLNKQKSRNNYKSKQIQRIYNLNIERIDYQKLNIKKIEISNKIPIKVDLRSKFPPIFLQSILPFLLLFTYFFI